MQTLRIKKGFYCTKTKSDNRLIYVTTSSCDYFLPIINTIEETGKADQSDERENATNYARQYLTVSYVAQCICIIPIPYLYKSLPTTLCAAHSKIPYESL